MSTDLDFDPNLFQPETLARLPPEVKAALVRVTRAAVASALFVRKHKSKRPSEIELRRGDLVCEEVAKSTLAYGQELLKAAGK